MVRTAGNNQIITHTHIYMYIYIYIHTHTHTDETGTLGIGKRPGNGVHVRRDINC